MWAMFTALGLSNLRYSEAGSSRNIIIVGLSLFFSLSVPAYFQQYGISPNSNLSVPSYYQPYIVSSHGPFKSQYKGVRYTFALTFTFTFTGPSVFKSYCVFAGELRDEHALIDEHGNCVHNGCDFGQHGAREQARTWSLCLV